MALEWVIIESLAVLIENLVKVYFIVSQMKTKLRPSFSISILVLIVSGWGVFATFSQVNQFVYNSVDLLLLLIGVYLCAAASIARKVLITLLATAIAFITSLTGVGIINLFIRITINSTINNQNSSRLLIIILIKMVQIVVFLLLSKRQLFSHDVSRTPVPILLVNSVLAFIVNLLIWFYISVTPVESIMNVVLIAASICTLLILLCGFFMYELLSRLEQQKSELSRKIQRSDMEATFREEIKNMHADLQKWRHEYKNNLVALKGYVTENDTVGALDYIDKIAEIPLVGKALVSTTRVALDAVINSKLWTKVCGLYH